MKPKFITPVSMQVTKEQYEKDLKEPLKELGYTLSNFDNFYDAPIIYNNYNIWAPEICSNGKIGCEKKKRRYFIDYYNPQLFLALATMTEGEELIQGEYLICIKATERYKEKELIRVSRVNEGHETEYIENSFSQRYSRNHFRKATKEEIIEKLSLNQMKRQDFTIGGTQALKEAFIKDGNFKLYGNKSINYKYLASDYYSDDLAGHSTKKEIHFQLPQDWDKAMEYVKDFFKLEFKVGDIIVNKEYPEKYIGAVRKIEGDIVHYSGTDQIKDVRHATPKEIEDYIIAPKLPKINDYNGVIEGDFIIYGNNCAKLPIAWFKEYEGATRTIKALELNSNIKISEEDMKQIYKVISKL